MCGSVTLFSLSALEEQCRRRALQFIGLLNIFFCEDTCSCLLPIFKNSSLIYFLYLVAYLFPVLKMFFDKQNLIFFFFGLFRATPMAYGGSQARGLIEAVAAGLHQSHSNTRSELCLQSTPQLMATPDP